MPVDFKKRRTARLWLDSYGEIGGAGTGDCTGGAECESGFVVGRDAVDGGCDRITGLCIKSTPEDWNPRGLIRRYSRKSFLFPGAHYIGHMIALSIGDAGIVDKVSVSRYR